MNIDERNNKNKPVTQFKATLDVGLGIMYIIVATMIYRIPRIFIRFGKTFTIILCSIIVLYGCYRIIRGVLLLLPTKKNKE